MDNFPWLSVITFAPLDGVFFILLIRGDEEVAAKNARGVALWTSLITFCVSLGIWVNFDNSAAGFQFEEKVVWVEDLGLAYHLGVDGISVFFVILSPLLTVLCIGASWLHKGPWGVYDRVSGSKTLMIGMFSASI